MSLSDFFRLINFLFLGNLMVFAWSVITAKRAWGRRSIPFWVAFFLLAGLLFRLDEYQRLINRNYTLPAELRAIYANRFFEYGSDCEWVYLPESDVCPPNLNPGTPRTMVNITRSGKIIKDRRPLLDPVKGSDLNLLCRDLTAEANRSSLTVAENAKHTLLIRADQTCDFWHIEHLVKICVEKKIGINRFELAYSFDYHRRFPQATEDMSPGYTLEGKFDLSVSLPFDERETIDLCLHLNPKTDRKDGFHLLVGEKRIDCSDIPSRLCAMLKDLHGKSRGKVFLVKAHRGIRVGHVAAVLGECQRAGVGHLTFCFFGFEELPN